MLGLEDYSSSSAEESHTDKLKESIRQLKTRQVLSSRVQSPYGTNNKQPAAGQERSQPSTGNDLPAGPIVGPSATPSATNLDSADDRETLPRDAKPELTYEEVVHSLTLPPVPNVAIPHSPPGSPLPSTSNKVSRFLELKNQGVHYNERLGTSIALRNPNILLSLMDFAGIDKNLGQYANTLPDEVAVIPKDGFSMEAYPEALAKAQQAGHKRREDERKQSGRVDFVHATKT